MDRGASAQLFHLRLRREFSPGNATRKYPTLYFLDGQNAFDECPAFHGEHELRIDESLTRLIAENKVPPMIVVGIDSTHDRDYEYEPYKNPRIYCLAPARSCAIRPCSIDHRIVWPWASAAQNWTFPRLRSPGAGRVEQERDARGCRKDDRNPRLKPAGGVPQACEGAACRGPGRKSQRGVLGAAHTC